MVVPPAELPGMLGVTMVTRAMPLALTDSTLA
jgi:hypothetical protein